MRAIFTNLHQRELRRRRAALPAGASEEVLVAAVSAQVKAAMAADTSESRMESKTLIASLAWSYVQDCPEMAPGVKSGEELVPALAAMDEAAFEKEAREQQLRSSRAAATEQQPQNSTRREAGVKQQPSSGRATAEQQPGQGKRSSSCCKSCVFHRLRIGYA